MRLTCPNCDAQYEVPDDVIPPDGRDVQCSNCGKTWFQSAVPGAEDEGVDAASASARPAPQEPPQAEPAPAAPRPMPQPAAAPEPAPQPRQLDPEVISVLREEAERENRVREAERGPVESQPDLGLDDMRGTTSDSELRAQQSRSRMARLRGEQETPAPKPGTAAAAAAASGSRRELLPDIEEINSTLRSTDQPRNTEASAEIAAGPDRIARSHFRRGFSWVLLLVAVAALLYAYSPQIAEAVPGLAAPLESYAAWVNGLRGWLDMRVLTALGWLDSMSSESLPSSG